MRRLLEAGVLLLVAAAVAWALWGRSQPVDLADLSIAGVQPGMTRPQVEALLGPAPTGRMQNGTMVTVYEGATLTWFGGRVSEVAGEELQRDGRPFLRAGVSADEVRRALGRPWVSAVGADSNRSVEEVWFRGSLTCTYREGRIVSFRLSPEGSSAGR